MQRRYQALIAVAVAVAVPSNASAATRTAQCAPAKGGIGTQTTYFSDAGQFGWRLDKMTYKVSKVDDNSSNVLLDFRNTQGIIFRQWVNNAAVVDRTYTYTFGNKYAQKGTNPSAGARFVFAKTNVNPDPECAATVSW